jgi:hypothetical protein
MSDEPVFPDTWSGIGTDARSLHAEGRRGRRGNDAFGLSDPASEQIRVQLWCNAMVASDTPAPLACCHYLGEGGANYGLAELLTGDDQCYLSDGLVVVENGRCVV